MPLVEMAAREKEYSVFAFRPSTVYEFLGPKVSFSCEREERGAEDRTRGGMRGAEKGIIKETRLSPADTAALDAGVNLFSFLLLSVLLSLCLVQKSTQKTGL